jgi:6-phosphofructokinase 1
VEVQGGRSGYIATLGGLSIGALAVYTPEEGINIHMLSADIDHLRESFAADQGQSRAGKLILRNEKASKTYTTDTITNMIREEAKGRFEARTAIPGHVQQGGTPSPMDRVRAIRLAVKCVSYLEKWQFDGDDSTDVDLSANPASVSTHPTHPPSSSETDPESESAAASKGDEMRKRRAEGVMSHPETSAVIGIIGANLVFKTMEDLETDEETDWDNRRPRRAFWGGLSEVVDVLSGRPKGAHVK